MGLLPDRQCVYSDALALGAQPFLRTSVSNPSRMKAIRLMTNGMAGDSLLGVWWTTWTRVTRERACGPVGAGCSEAQVTVSLFSLSVNALHPASCDTQNRYNINFKHSLLRTVTAAAAHFA